MELPTGGTCFVSVCDRDKRAILPLARDLSRMGFKLLCTEGTCRALTAASIPCEVIGRIGSEEPNIGTKIMDGEIDLVINTPFGQETRGDGYQLRTMCVRQNLCYVTTLAGAQAFFLPLKTCASKPACDCPAGSRAVGRKVAFMADILDKTGVVVSNRQLF